MTTTADPRPPSDATIRGIALFALVAAGYALGSELAFRIADAAGLQAVVFLPAGLTLAALLAVPTRQWWIVLVAAGAAELVQDLRAGLDVAESAGFVLANVVEPLIGASVIRRAIRRPIDLARSRDVYWFVGAGVALGPAVGALIGAYSDNRLGGDGFSETFAQWWLGDALGALLIGGVIMAWRSSQDRRSMLTIDGVALLGGSVGLTILVLTKSDLPLMFTVLTGVVVAGAGFGVRAVTTTALAVAMTAAITFAVDDGAVMVGVSESTALLVVKLKLLVFTIGGLVVAAEAFERELMTLARAQIERAAAEEHEFVVRLQRHLLPAMSVCGEHFEAEGIYLPASEGLQLGGDWYDALELLDGRVFVSIGDVVGHGAEAAATMSQLKVTISVLATEVEGPAELLALVDEVAVRIPGAFCATVWVGFYDPARKVLRYASAGHPPGFLVTAGDVVRLDAEVSPPILVDPGGPRTAAEICTGDQATLVLYTDGLVQQHGESIDDGMDRVAEALETARRSGTRSIDVLETLDHDVLDDTVLFEVVLR